MIPSIVQEEESTVSNSRIPETVSRRKLLRFGAAATVFGGLSSLLAACQQATPTPAPPAKTTDKPAAAPTQAPAKPADKPAAQPTQAPAKAQTQPASKGVVQIRTHDWLQDPDNKFYGPFIEKFEKEHPNIKWVREWFPRDDMHTKILTLAATGQVGDVVRINVAVLTPELKNKNVIQSLTPFIKADKTWSEKDHPQFWPGNLANYTIKGEQYGYPVVGHPGCVQYYTNVTMMEKVGAKIPTTDGKWTQEEALAVFTAATKSEGGRTTVYGLLPCLGGEGAVGVLRAFGGDYYNEEGTQALVGKKESIDGIAYLQDLYQKHKVAIPTEAKPNAQQLFPGERVGIVVSTSGLAGFFRQQVGQKFKWLILPPPIGPSGKHETQVSSDGIGMSKITKSPDEAWEVIKAYGSKEHGVDRHLAGLGSPGSRYDVWTDPKFKEAQPELSGLIYNTLVDPQKAPPLRPWNHPANGRYFETDKAINSILEDVWLGKKTPADAAAEAQKAAQAIMDQEPA